MGLRQLRLVLLELALQPLDLGIAALQPALQPVDLVGPLLELLRLGGDLAFFVGDRLVRLRQLVGQIGELAVAVRDLGVERVDLLALALEVQPQPLDVALQLLGRRLVLLARAEEVGLDLDRKSVV